MVGFKRWRARRFWRRNGYWPLDAAIQNAARMGLVGPEAEAVVTREWYKTRDWIEYGIRRDRYGIPRGAA